MRADDRGVVLGLHRSGHRRMTLEAALGLGVHRLDTAFNYLNFTSHATLARVAGDLLGEFTISTKVGYFPHGHGLDPERLRQAVEQSAADLGHPPDLVFLHNPERTLTHLAPSEGSDALGAAIGVLTDAKAQGLTKGWGISSWRAAALAPYAATLLATGWRPAVDALMTRCGLTVSPSALEAAEHLAGLLGVSGTSWWGMAPFGGDTGAVGWPPAHTFAPGRRCSPVQAAFAAAYHLPKVAAVAVRADQPHHLSELLAAARLSIDQGRVAAYRALLADRKATVTP